MKRKHIYLFLALCGIVFPWYFNMQYFAITPDASIIDFFAQTRTTLPAQSIAVDISLVVVTFLVWLITESRRLKMHYGLVLLVIAATFLVAIAFSFPLFMYLRERKLEKLNIEY